MRALLQAKMSMQRDTRGEGTREESTRIEELSKVEAPKNNTCFILIDLESIYEIKMI